MRLDQVSYPLDKYRYLISNPLNIKILLLLLLLQAAHAFRSQVSYPYT